MEGDRKPLVGHVCTAANIDRFDSSSSHLLPPPPSSSLLLSPHHSLSTNRHSWRWRLRICPGKWREQRQQTLGWGGEGWGGEGWGVKGEEVRGWGGEGWGGEDVGIEWKIKGHLPCVLLSQLIMLFCRISGSRWTWQRWSDWLCCEILCLMTKLLPNSSFVEY